MPAPDWDLSCKVYVGNLGNNASKYDLEDVFRKYGKLRNVWVARNPPGFAFVEFESPRDAEEAVTALDGTRCCGTRIRVEMSNGRKRRERFNSRSRSRSPRFRRRSLSRGRSFSPRRSPSVRRRSPSVRRRSPSIRRRSPSIRRRSPSVRRRSPSYRRRSLSPRRSRSRDRRSRSTSRNRY